MTLAGCIRKDMDLSRHYCCERAQKILSDRGFFVSYLFGLLYLLYLIYLYRCGITTTEKLEPFQLLYGCTYYSSHRRNLSNLRQSTCHTHGTQRSNAGRYSNGRRSALRNHAIYSDPSSRSATHSGQQKRSSRWCPFRNPQRRPFSLLFSLEEQSR